MLAIQVPQREAVKRFLRWKSDSSGPHEERKKSYAEVAKLYSKNKSSICEILKKEKEIRVSTAVAPQTAKVTV